MFTMTYTNRLLVSLFFVLTFGVIGIFRKTSQESTVPPTSREEAVDRMLSSNQQQDEKILAGDEQPATRRSAT